MSYAPSLRAERAAWDDEAREEWDNKSMEYETAGMSTLVGARPAAWRRLALMIALVVLVHQFVMLSPMHEHIMPMVFPVEPGATTPHMGHPAPAHPTPVIEECPATVAALFHTGSLLFLLLFCLVLILAVRAAVVSERVVVSHWLWPPDRRRALLQVFLC